MKIPEGYQQVMPYLIVRDAAKFIDFTSKIFGAVEKLKIMRDEKLIQHAEIKIGASVIMFADATGEFQPRPAALFVYVKDADWTYNKALAEGATSVMSMSDQEYGRSGGFTDPFGNVWWPTTPPKDDSAAESRR
jgi:PhnB protein